MEAGLEEAVKISRMPKLFKLLDARQVIQVMSRSQGLFKLLDARQDLKDACLFHRRLKPHDVGFGLCLYQKIWHIMLHGPAGYRVHNDLQSKSGY